MIFQQHQQVKKAGYIAYDSQMRNRRMDGIFSHVPGNFS